MDYALGLDIGSESVGWSVVELDSDGEPRRIAALGVRAFEALQSEGVQATTPAADRRLARSQRRRLRNRARRRRRLIQLMREQGLITEEEDARNLGATQPGDPSPWELRARGLDELLSRRDWARVLLHIVRHRGFRSTRRDKAGKGGDDAQKTGQMKSSISAIHEAYTSLGYRTVAEYMMSPDWPYGPQKRNKAGSYTCTIGRDDLLDEVHRLFDAQRSLGNEWASKGFEDAYVAILDEPPNLTEGEDAIAKVGRCFLLPEERRAPKCTYTAERFIALQRLNDARLVDMRTGEKRPLTAEEIEAVLELGYKRKTAVKCASALKELRKASDDVTENCLFDVRLGKEKTLDAANKTTVLVKFDAYNALRAALEERHPEFWERLATDDALMDSIGSVLTYYLLPENTTAALVDLGVPEDAARTLADEVVFSGHVRLSLAAMRRLIPHMECGVGYAEACRREGLDHSQRPEGEGKPRLPVPDDLERITNPNVKRAIMQTRKVVNAVIREFGMPKRIGVELARDAARSPQARRQIEQRISARTKEKEATKQKIAEIAPGVDPDRLWRKYELYEQQGGKCAYSLKPLQIERVLTDATYTEIDHIVPRSVCFNDSMANKVLVLTSENREKGNRFAADFVLDKYGSEHFAEYEAWVGGLDASPRKKKNLLRREADFTEEDKRQMMDRYLHATQYAARYICEYLRSNLDIRGQDVIPVNGQMTADLRWLWGLEGMKEREVSDKHHALDATVVAIATPALVKRCAEYFKLKETTIRGNKRGERVDPLTGEIFTVHGLTEPYPEFSQEIAARLSDDPRAEIEKLGLATYDAEALEQVRPVFVSRMPRRKVSGRGHKDTLFSIRHLEDQIGQEARETGRIALSGDARPIKKTMLTSLSATQIKQILEEPSPILVDEEHNKVLYDLIRERLRKFEGARNWAEEAFKEPLRMPTKDGSEGPVVRSIRLYVDVTSGRLVRGALAEADSIVRVDIYKAKQPKGRSIHFCVPVYAADLARGWIPNRAAKQGKPEAEWPVMDEDYEFLFSIWRGDYFRAWKSESEPGPILYMTSFDRSSVILKGSYHDRSNRNEKGAVKPVRVSIPTNPLIEKFEVDVLGRLHRVRKEPRPGWA